MDQFIWALVRIVRIAIINTYMESVYLNIERW